MPIIPHDRIVKAEENVKNFAHEFKSFISKGNAIELAIGVVIGTAFNDMVNSLVKDVIMGIIATIFKKPDLTTLAYGAIKWGSFLNSVLNLLIVGFSVFVTIKIMGRLTHKDYLHKPEVKK